MELRKSSRKRAKIRLGLQGPSGSGKTFSALLVAFGLCGDFSKVVVIDSENNSADLYSNLGSFNVLNISQPFTPEKYIQAIQASESAGMEVIIADSITHEWEEILNLHSRMIGNSFTNWGKLTPRHNAFIQAMLQSKAHIIATIRTKQDYILNEKDGKQVPTKIGLKGVQRDGMDYELTLVFDLDMRNHATASKDRTGLFFGKPELKLTSETGQRIRDWCNEGGDDQEIEALIVKIRNMISVDDLVTLFKTNPLYQDLLLPHFSKRRSQLGLVNPLIDQKSTENGYPE